MTEYERLTNAGKDYTESEAIDRLWELEDKIENGTLVELPCKVGDTVYEPTEIEIRDWKVISINIKEEISIAVMNLGFVAEITINEFYKHCYKTKAEAEKRLAELRGEI